MCQFTINNVRTCANNPKFSSLNPDLWAAMVIVSNTELFKTLDAVYGYKSFRPLQQEAIESVLSGKDTLVILPTGGGKSICFQVPAIATQGLCLVVSPLISLMKDQVQALEKNGIKAAFVNSSLSSAENNDILRQAQSNELSLLYISPEKLVSDIQWLSQLPVKFIAIDEAHCVSQWGHDFRPEYTQLKMVKEYFKEAPIMALTATADKVTRRDMAEQLGMAEPTELVGSFNRTNLSLEVRANLPAKEKYRQIANMINKYADDSGIVYCLSRKNTEKLAEVLDEMGIKAGVYHAGLSHEQRNKVQEDFINDRLKVICATIAFGMGIDKSNVRYVVHYNLPKNIESYYQEIGRAGRDSMPSETRLYYNYGDLKILTQFAADGAQAQVNLEKLNRMHQYAEADVCRRKILLSYFGEVLEKDCGNCDVCQSPRKHFDGTVVAQKAMSALKRMNEEVGMNLLIDVLRGSNKAEVLEKGYDQIKTYGAGREFSYFEWQHYVNQMINLGLIEIAYDENFALKVTTSGTDVLFGKRELPLVVYERQKESAAKPAKKKTKKEVREEGLFGELKRLRLEISREEGGPAYTVFSDATLSEMAANSPLFLDELSEVSGVGRHKLKKYGNAFLQAIRSYVLSNDVGKVTGMSYVETLQLYEEGLAATEIAQKREINVATVYSHLAILIEKGEKIDVSPYLSKADLKDIKKAIAHLESHENLKAIHEYLDERIEYGLVKLGVSYLA